MLGIAVELGRPTHVALGEHADAVAAQRESRGVVERPPRNDVLGLADVGDDFFDRLAARGRTSERERRPHQLHEATPADRVGEFGRLLRELAVQVFHELGSLGEFVQAAPVLLAVGARELFTHLRELVGLGAVLLHR